MSTLFFLIGMWIVIVALYKVIKIVVTASDDKSKNPNSLIVVILKKILWFKKFVLIGLGLLSLTIILFDTVYVTSEQEIGFISTCGNNEMIDNAGIHLKIPFFSEKYTFDATTQGMPIGYNITNNESITEDSLMITSDFNFVNIDFYLEYKISDPIAYKYSTSEPDNLLKNISLAAIRNTVGQFKVDEVLTTGKTEIESKVFDDISNTLEQYNTGLSVLNITIQDAEAPNSSVQAAFKAVEDAKQQAETKNNEAKKYENEQIPAAEANASKIKASAEATKAERINEATEEVARFEALYTEYCKNKEAVKSKMYYDTIGKILPNMDIIVGSDNIVYIKGNTNSVLSNIYEENNNSTESIEMSDDN